MLQRCTIDTLADRKRRICAAHYAIAYIQPGPLPSVGSLLTIKYQGEGGRWFTDDVPMNLISSITPLHGAA